MAVRAKMRLCRNESSRRKRVGKKGGKVKEEKSLAERKEKAKIIRRLQDYPNRQ